MRRLHIKCSLLLSDLKETWIFSTLSRGKKPSTATFHQNPFNRNRVVRCGRTHGHDEANSHFPQICEQVHVTFVVAKVALLQVFLKVLGSNPVGTIPSVFHTHISFICHRRYIILAINQVVTRNTPFPLKQLDTVRPFVSKFLFGF
jgi:hypothetical protein